MTDDPVGKPVAATSSEGAPLPDPPAPAIEQPVQGAQSASSTAGVSTTTASSIVTSDGNTALSSASGQSSSNSAGSAQSASSVPGSQSTDNNHISTTYQAGPPVPARSYPRDPRLLTYASLPIRRPPNRVLPRFFKVLAVLIFVTGTSATLLTFLYQRFILPKLLLSRARMASIHRHQLSLYDKLVHSAHSLVYSNETLYPKSQLKLAQTVAPDPTLPPATLKDVAKIEAMPNESVSSESEEEPLFADESPLEKSKESLDPLPSNDSITSQLQHSLARLRNVLQHQQGEDKSTLVADKDGALPVQTSSQLALDSLEKLSTYLTNESFYASTPAFSAATYGWNYGGGASQIPQRSGMDRDKISQLKNEIRSLKGMLLTRRNFAIPKQEVST